MGGSCKVRQTGKLLTFTRTSYFLPFTFYLLPFTFHLLLFTSSV